MKKTLLFVGMILAGSVSAQFINGGFEQWDTVSMFGQPFERPTGWDSNNDNDIESGLANTPVTRGVDSTGYYARIESNDHGIDALLPGILKQTIAAKHLRQIDFQSKCEYIFQAGACVVNLYQGNSNLLLYTDSLFSEDMAFQARSIDIWPEWIAQNDSLTIEFVAKGNLDDWDGQEDGHSVFFIDNVSASYISATNESLSHEHVIVYPNPSSGVVYLELASGTRPYRVELFNNHGYLIYTDMADQRFTVQGLSDGYYYFRCRVGNQMVIKPFVVIH